MLPAIAVAITVLSLFVPFAKSEGDESSTPSPGAFLVLAILATAGVIAGLRYGSALPGLTGASLGFGLGSLLSALAGGLGFTALRRKADSVPLALALVAASATPWLGEGGPLGLIIGAGLAAWLSGFGAERESPLATRSAAVCVAIVAANLLGAKWPGTFGPQAGLILGTVAVGSWVIASLALQGIARIVLAVGLAGVAGFLVCTRLLNASDLWMVFLGGIGLGALIAWFVDDSEPAGVFPAALACVMWVAGATAAFAYYKGLGMATLLIGGTVTIMALGRKLALSTLGPLVALVLFRVFREQYTEATRALDIGQHYAIIGLILGAMLPLLAYEWRQGPGLRASGRALAGASWVALFLFFPLAAGVLLGAKGTIGLLVGAGFAGAIGALRGDANGHATTLGAAFAAILVLGYGWIVPYMDLGRNDKLQTLVWLAGVVLVLSVLIAALSLNLNSKQAIAKP